MISGSSNDGCWIVYDIETGCKDLEEMRFIDGGFDRTAIAHPGQFDPGAIKYGRMTDPEKREQKMAAAILKHQQALEDYEFAVSKAASDYDQQLLNDGALRAELCRVLTIGVRTSTGLTIIPESDNEAEIISGFWDRLKYHLMKSQLCISFNGHNFDLPVLIRRSMILGLQVPHCLRSNRRWWHQSLIDLREEWRCGVYGLSKRENISLDRLSRAMGRAGKTGSGKNFSYLWQNERESAISYLKADLVETEFAARRMGWFP